MWIRHRPYAPYYTVVLPSLALESLGITHTSYVLKDVFVRLSGADRKRDDPKQMKKNKLYAGLSTTTLHIRRAPLQVLCESIDCEWRCEPIVDCAMSPSLVFSQRSCSNDRYYARCIMSVGLVIFSTIFVLKGLFSGQTGATNGVGWNNLPGWAAFIITIFFLFVIGCCEGFQIAAVSLSQVPSDDFKTEAPTAYKTTQLLYAGRNMQAFLVGRQVFVAMMMVLLGKVTSYAGSEGVLVEGDDWGMGTEFNRILLQTGILGAIFVVNVGQLSFRMAASCFPVMFINNFVVNFLLRVVLVVEATGVVNSCWPLAWGLDSMLGLTSDNFDGDGDEWVNTAAQHVPDRKRSMGVPVNKGGAGPYDLHPTGIYAHSYV